jgi:hypothetical protein
VTSVSYEWDCRDALHGNQPPPHGTQTAESFDVEISKNARHEVDVTLTVTVACDRVLCQTKSIIHKFTFDSKGHLRRIR